MVKRMESRLSALCAVCQELGAEVRCDPERGYFTATVWNGWEQEEQKDSALAIQQTIKQETAQHDGLVCYCFDPFSTLVYMV